ncbi:MAG: hypothetical protein KC609_26955, partial [Myxococcales bacterium]|nr:hypothetical protein [Myxococcales bacterium]
VLGSSATGVDGGAPWPSFRHDPKNRGTSAYAPSSCTIRRNLTPFRLETSLLPGATPGQILLSGVVAHVGGGATPDECRFLSLKNDSGQLIELCVQLPAGYEIPVVPGESIVLEYSAIGSAEGGLYERYVIWDKSGALRFFYWSGDLPYYDPATCAHDCPKLAFSKSSCPTEELSCGLIVHPALELSIPGGCNETTVVAPGEIRTFENLTDLCPPFRARVMVARTRKYQTMLCEDVPDTYAQLAIIVNQSVSQCNCSDNGDCRSNEICDTEARRCVPNRCLEGVNCGPTTTCNPYNGNCEALPEPQMACDTSANCLPGWVCNPQWRSILGHGLCQKNPCTLMDCNGGCSGLSGCIGACLSNCDCKKPGNVDGVCDVESRSCID